MQSDAVLPDNLLPGSIGVLVPDTDIQRLLKSCVPLFPLAGVTTQTPLAAHADASDRDPWRASA
jgi:hypothetical protein